jgi:hypothetical protein
VGGAPLSKRGVWTPPFRATAFFLKTKKKLQIVKIIGQSVSQSDFLTSVRIVCQFLRLFLRIRQKNDRRMEKGVENDHFGVKNAGPKFLPALLVGWVKFCGMRSSLVGPSPPLPSK